MKMEDSALLLSRLVLALCEGQSIEGVARSKAFEDWQKQVESSWEKLSAEDKEKIKSRWKDAIDQKFPIEKNANLLIKKLIDVSQNDLSDIGLYFASDAFPPGYSNDTTKKSGVTIQCGYNGCNRTYIFTEYDEQKLDMVCQNDDINLPLHNLRGDTV